jgi:hypothetical protein
MDPHAYSYLFGTLLVVLCVALIFGLRGAFGEGRHFRPSHSRYHSNPALDRLKRCVQDRLEELRRRSFEELAAQTGNSGHVLTRPGPTTTLSTQIDPLPDGGLRVSVTASERRLAGRALRWSDGFSVSRATPKPDLPRPTAA